MWTQMSVTKFFHANETTEDFRQRLKTRKKAQTKNQNKQMAKREVTAYTCHHKG